MTKSRQGACLPVVSAGRRGKKEKKREKEKEKNKLMWSL